MKKTLLALACIGGLGLSATATTYTDVFDVDALQLGAAFADMDEINGYWDTGKMVFEMEGSDSGVTYQIGMPFVEEGEFFGFYTDGYVSTKETNGLFLKSVKLTTRPYYSKGMSVYGRTEAVEYHADYQDNPVPNVGYDYSKYEQYPGNTSIYSDSDYYSDEALYIVEEPFNHLVCSFSSSSDAQFVSLEITWTDEAIVPQVKTPSIEVSKANGAVKPGTVAYFYTSTEDATIHYSVVKNEVEVVADAEGTEYTLDGVYGDTFTLKAWAVKEGYNDSEVAEYTCELSQPKLEAPYAYLRDNKPMNGTEIQISANNYGPDYAPIGTIIYTINDGEEVTVTEPYASVKISGNEGDTWTLKAWVVEEGYLTSDVTELTYEIASSRLDAPYIEVNGSTPDENEEYAIGSEIYIWGNEAYMGTLMISINGGEWFESESSYYSIEDVQATTTVKAYIKADTEARDNRTDYSNRTDSKVSEATVNIEVITADMDVILPSTFTEKSINWNKVEEKTALLNNTEYVSFAEIYQNQNYKENCTITLDRRVSTYVTNNTPIQNGVQAVKFDFMYNNWNAIHVYFGNEKFINCSGHTFATDSEDGTVTVGCAGHRDEFDAIVANSANEVVLSKDEFDGKWFNLKDYDKANGTALAGSKYIFVTSVPDGESKFTRMIVSTNQTTGVEGVAVETALEEGVYNLQGVRVNSEKLVPGIYVKVANGKAAKVVVK